MVPVTQPPQGHEMPKGGTALGDECGRCTRRWSVRHYIAGRWLCDPCVQEIHNDAASNGRI